MDQSRRFTVDIKDTRTYNEKILTDELARALTQLNLKRVSQKTNGSV